MEMQTDRLHRDVLKCRKARQVQKEMMMARSTCKEFKTIKISRIGYCLRTGKSEGCAGKELLCPLQGAKNINFGKVR
jgi:hypothetical protein